jgi:hypothetical protein
METSNEILTFVEKLKVPNTTEEITAYRKRWKNQRLKCTKL